MLSSVALAMEYESQSLIAEHEPPGFMAYVESRIENAAGPHDDDQS
jgi:hypothetical protein